MLSIKDIKKRSTSIVHKRSFVVALSCCLITFFSLYFFEPISINEHANDLKFVWNSIYSTIPALMFYLFYLIKKISKQRQTEFRTLGFDLLSVLIVCTVSGLIIYLYTIVLMYIFEIRVSLPPHFLLECFKSSFTLGLYIYLVLKLLNFIAHLIKENQLLKQQQATAKIPGNNSSNIKLYGKCKSDGIYAYDIENILYIESDHNNVIINIIERRRLKKIVLRQSLKGIEEQFKKIDHNPFFKCHKSFIINLEKLKKLNGNSRTATVILEENIYIPVARIRYSTLRNLLTKNSLPQMSLSH